ncbi:MAG: GNAT family N-acetyltransferase [Acidobacteria bacterium]|nr:GNAT family N-acetyltransferase [Acidobacteriota bacterium]
MTASRSKAASLTPPPDESQITIRHLSGAEEINECVALESEIWHFSDADLVPGQIFVVAERTGGQVIGAFDRSRPVGFVLAFAAIRDRRFYLHSHMAAVLPAYQNRGIGRRLKLAQRDDALARSIDLIEWSFDPLQLKNAHFNIVRLGATVREYVPNLYGRTSSPLHSGIATDRLVAQWWIRHPRVAAILAGKPPKPAQSAQPISVPLNIRELVEGDPEAAKKAQSEIRMQFQQFFSRSLEVSGFDMDEREGRYLLEPYKH